MIRKAAVVFMLAAFVVVFSGCETAKKIDAWMQKNLW